MKKVIKNALACIILVVIGIPLFLAIALATSVIGWPVYGICYIADEIRQLASGERTSETIEEAIFLFYGLAAVCICFPLAVVDSEL